METFVSSSKEIFAKLLRAGTLQMDGGAVKNYGELDLRRQRERDGEIDALLGSYFPQQLTDIEYLLNKGFPSHLHDIELLPLQEGSLQQEYDAVRSRLNEVQLKYEFFARHPGPDTWELFKMSFPQQDIDWLYKRITEHSAIRPNLMSNLLDICTSREFTFWQQDICLTFARAYALQCAHIYHSVFRPYDRSDSSAVFLPALPAAVEEELESMQTRTQHVADVVNEKSRQLKASFLFKKGDNPHHKQSGWESTDGCCELAAKIYPQLTNEAALTNDDLAEQIAGRLREFYPYLRWSVVVVNDYHAVEFQLSTRNHDDIWLHRLGTRRTAVMQSPVTDNVIMSRGLGGYGCFLCYRVEPPCTEKAALVFWADPDLLKCADLVKECDSVMNNWRRDGDAIDLSKNGNGYSVASWLREKGKDFVFGAGLCTESSEDIGMDLHGDRKYTFPLFLGDRTGFVLTWPEVFAVPETLKCEVSEADLGELSSGKYSGYRVYKGRRKNTAVAVKTFSLSLQKYDNELKCDLRVHAQRKREIATLDDNFRDMNVLKEFCHPNVVRYLGCQPAESIDPTSYQIVMEYCAGGSLTDRVTEPVTLFDVFGWTLEVLKGLSYLHGINIAHKDIQGDHMQFQGPKKGQGYLKIISVGRIGEIMSQSKPLENERKSSFQPPEAPGMSGSKTDIYSLGCVILQMITGGHPCVNPDTGRAVIPDGLPARWADLLERCLQEPYAARPCAAALFDMLSYDRKSFVGEDWSCPARIPAG